MPGFWLTKIQLLLTCQRPLWALCHQHRPRGLLSMESQSSASGLTHPFKSDGLVNSTKYSGTSLVICAHNILMGNPNVPHKTHTLQTPVNFRIAILISN